MADSALILKGPTVTLRPLTEGDAPLLAAAAAERSTYAFTWVPRDEETAASYIAQALAERDAGRRLPFLILWHDRPAGSTSYLDIQKWQWPEESPFARGGPDAVEIGATWLAAPAQRTRCNTEAKLLLLTHAFDVWDVHRVTLKTDERNLRSRAAIERLGARFEGVRRADMPAADGTIRSTALYSILPAEWPAIRERLHAALEL